MMLNRRKNYPRVKILGGLYSVRREPKDDPISREIKDAVNCMPVQRHVLRSAVTLVERPGM
jgi:hypothetical protein